MEFAGKVALVTGAASGIGAATARLLVAGGAKLFAVDVNAEALETLVAEAGGDAVAHVADMSDSDQVEGMVDACVAQFGGLDILVNNAGIGSLGKVTDVDPAEWRKVMAIDLDAIFFACRKAMPHLVARKGSVVNTASISGMAADYGFAAYNTAKAAVIGLTRNMAIDFGKDGVRVNSVSPGPIDTPLLSVTPPELLAHWGGLVPMRRLGRAEEIAEVILFLASARASYLTGQNIAVDGGLTAHTGQPDVLGFFSQGAQ